MAGKFVQHVEGYHCETPRFEIRTSAKIEIHDCNCSSWRLSGYLYLIVPEQFQCQYLLP